MTQIILGAVNFVATFGGLYIMEKFGRRWPLIIGGLWMSLWLFVFASVGVTRDVASDKGAGVRTYDNCAPAKLRLTFDHRSHDCFCVPVHRWLRNDMGTWYMDHHRRVLRTSHSS